VEGVANLVSSTALSIPSSPEDRACEINGRDARAFPQATPRRARQEDVPVSMDR
jgi:hypothetical protein